MTPTAVFFLFSIFPICSVQQKGKIRHQTFFCVKRVRDYVVLEIIEKNRENKSMEEKRSYSRQVSSASGVDSFVLAGEDHIKEQNQDLSGITGANLFQWFSSSPFLLVK